MPKTIETMRLRLERAEYQPVADVEVPRPDVGRLVSAVSTAMSSAQAQAGGGPQTALRIVRPDGGVYYEGTVPVAAVEAIAALFAAPA